LYRYPGTKFDIVAQSEFEEVVQLIVGDLDSKQNLFVSGASIALGEVGRYGVIPSADPRKNIEKLITTVRDTKDIKTQEYAIASLGHIGVGNPAHAEEILKFFYDFGPKQTKQTEVNFTIGEAVACIGAGWECTAMDVFADVADQEPKKASVTDDIMDSILATILNDMAPSPKAATKKTACIWLLSLVKFCSTHTSVKVRKARTANTFDVVVSAIVILTVNFISL
jgi:proteasome component ECM29